MRNYAQELALTAPETYDDEPKDAVGFSLENGRNGASDRPAAASNVGG